ncbi:MAG: hypothetical protein QOD72_1837 [Acidimicrobiaceae bacterium]|nr:hypothetical protein [Acidimicrobiaceae bacterium]
MDDRVVRGLVVDEREPTGIVGGLEVPLTFMEQSVVVAAQQNKIVEGGGPTVGPVSDVVAVGVAATGAAREPATTVTYV